ncbi:MAG: hypothetical protein PHN64_00775 [Desulfovibrionaceae bacterium]|nr:hypothetical protein [Desulfovibrionaceae bacterium]
MEQLLLKIARQLDGMDEASLMALWNKYATLVSRFEPTKRWEEAALVFSLIQAKRWKNQLFNYNWSTRLHTQEDKTHTNLPQNSFTLERPAPAAPRQKCTILPFRRPQDSKEKK